MYLDMLKEAHVAASAASVCAHTDLHQRAQGGRAHIVCTGSVSDIQEPAWYVHAAVPHIHWQDAEVWESMTPAQYEAGREGLTTAQQV